MSLPESHPHARSRLFSLASYSPHRVPLKSFRVRTYNDELVMEYQVPAEGPVQPVVRACGNLASQEPALYPEGKDAEFQSLVHDQNAPCVGPTRDWSCIRRLSREEWLARGSEGYGFLANETTPNRVGLQTDSGCVIPLPLLSHSMQHMMRISFSMAWSVHSFFVCVSHPVSPCAHMIRHRFHTMYCSDTSPFALWYVPITLSPSI